MSEDNPEMDFAVKHADDFASLIEQPGWQALGAKVVEEIREKQEEVFNGEPTANIAYQQGYVAALKLVMTYPSLIIQAAEQSNEAASDKKMRRGRIRAIAGK